MKRIYDYAGYTVEVSVEVGFSHCVSDRAESADFNAVVRVILSNTPIAVFSAVRFGEKYSRLFTTEVDALMGGFSAAQRVLDEISGVGLSFIRTSQGGYTKSIGRRVSPRTHRPDF